MELKVAREETTHPAVGLAVLVLRLEEVLPVRRARDPVLVPIHLVHPAHLDLVHPVPVPSGVASNAASSVDPESVCS